MIIEKDIIEKIYNGNIFETAVKFRVSIQTIMASLKKYKINFEKPKHIYGDLKRTDFSDFQKSILIGSILGDGHLEKRSHLKNASFREEHAIDQVEWLKWKHSNLKPFTTANMWIRDRGTKALMPDGKGGKKYYNIQNVCAMSTGVHPYLTKLHNLFYKDRVKILPNSFITDNFDLISLAVLIGDDGYHNKERNYIVLCLESFSYTEILLLEKCINNLGVKFTSVIKHSKSPVSYRLYLNNVSINKELLTNSINILPKCMHHKVSPVLNEHQVATQ